MIAGELTQASKPLISIIIPTCKRTTMLSECLRRLLPQVNALPHLCEIIVCDNGDADATKAALGIEFPDVTCHGVAKRGPAATRNFGADLAQGEWLIFLDDDVLPQDGLMKAYANAFLSAKNGDLGFEGATLTDRSSPSLLWEAPFNPNCDGHPSCNWGLRKSLFLEVGGFDERYVRAQDVEFAARIGAMGHKFLPLKEAVVVHPLRPIPRPRDLAARWEFKLVYSLEVGAHPAIALYRLPWHALLVIQSRFRNQPWKKDNFLAVTIFAKEWLYVLWFTPGWIKKWSRAYRSAFWERKVGEGYCLPAYGL